MHYHCPRYKFSVIAGNSLADAPPKQCRNGQAACFLPFFCVTFFGSTSYSPAKEFKLSGAQGRVTRKPRGLKGRPDLSYACAFSLAEKTKPKTLFLLHLTSSAWKFALLAGPLPT